MNTHKKPLCGHASWCIYNDAQKYFTGDQGELLEGSYNENELAQHSITHLVHSQIKERHNEIS